MCKRKEVRGVEGRIDDRMTSEPINLYTYKCMYSSSFVIIVMICIGL